MISKAYTIAFTNPPPIFGTPCILLLYQTLTHYIFTIAFLTQWNQILFKIMPNWMILIKVNLCLSYIIPSCGFWLG